jgi:spore coat protein U-like protein
MRVFGKILFITFITLFAAECNAASCSVTTTPVVFNNYDVFSASPTNSSGRIVVNCNLLPSQSMQVAISISTGGSGTFNTRQMKSATNSERLNYNLYTDPSCSAIWGDGSGGTSTVAARVSRQSSLTAPVYGTIPARQNLSAGNYSDTLVVTVTW